ncbi:hypothetical protein [Bradyrhizobium sp. Ai1a-2]|nr:hypothetical protein [Bradyrhizobium sp. Ai1a-2]
MDRILWQRAEAIAASAMSDIGEGRDYRSELHRSDLGYLFDDEDG